MDGPAPERPPDPQGPQSRLDPFQDQLAAKAPVPWVTLALLGLNAAVYVAMLLAGVPFLDPGVPSLLQWGANLGSLTTSGQWWRLFTCTFLHIGLLHLLFNLFVLWGIGRFLERLLGRPSFATVYLLSGLAGSIASMWWDPFVVSAGASGAIFGLYGCLIGYLFAGSRDMPAEVAKKLSRNALLFLGYNLIWGLTHRGLDLAGHLGGLGGGLACGFALATFLGREGPLAARRITLRVLLSGLAILALAAGSRPRTPDLQQELARFAETEARVQASYNQALQQARAGTLGDPAFARLMEADVLGPWHRARQRLEGLQGLPAAQTQLLNRIERYAETRERAWVAFTEALREGDPRGIQRAAALHAEAEGLLKDLGR